MTTNKSEIHNGRTPVDLAGPGKMPIVSVAAKHPEVCNCNASASRLKKSKDNRAMHWLNVMNNLTVGDYSCHDASPYMDSSCMWGDMTTNTLTEWTNRGNHDSAATDELYNPCNGVDSVVKVDDKEN